MAKQTDHEALKFHMFYPFNMNICFSCTCPIGLVRIVSNGLGGKTQARHKLITDNRLFRSQPYSVNSSNCETARQQCEAHCFRAGRCAHLSCYINKGID